MEITVVEIILYLVFFIGVPFLMGHLFFPNAR